MQLVHGDVHLVIRQGPHVPSYCKAFVCSQHHDKVCKDAERLHYEKAWGQTQTLQCEGTFVGYAQ